MITHLACSRAGTQIEGGQLQGLSSLAILSPAWFVRLQLPLQYLSECNTFMCGFSFFKLGNRGTKTSNMSHQAFGSNYTFARKTGQKNVPSCLVSMLVTKMWTVW